MKTVNRFVAWICLFSTTVMGCYTSSLVEPTGDEKQRLEKGEIAGVVMKNGREYKFDEPAIIVEEAIIGKVKYRFEPVSLPITDVAEVYLSEFDVVVTVYAIVVPLVIVGYVAGEISQALSKSYF